MKQTILRFFGMTGIAIAASFASGISSSATEGVFLSTGHRLLVKTEGRRDFKPRIVNCAQSSIELCLRDTDGTPPNNPIEPHADGLTVNFPGWGVVYIVHENGTGRTFLEGKEVKPFTWSMIPE